MKEGSVRTFMRLTRGAPVVAALLALLCALAPLAAEAVPLAGSAGNTIIRNTITVDYSDANGAAQTPVISTVDLTVEIVAATPTVLSFIPLVPSASPGSTDGAGATQTYAVRIRTNSNGPGTVTLAASDGSFLNVAAGTAPAVAPGSIDLGSTIIDPSEVKNGTAQIVAIAGSIVLAVPNDGGTVNSVINGLAVGDLVYLTDGANNYYGPFHIGAVSDPLAGSGSTPLPGSVTLVNDIAGAAIGPFTPQFGWQIVEASDVTLTVTQGLIPIGSANSASSWVTTVSATMAAAAPGTGTVTTNAHMGRIDVKKYVRNVNTPVVGTGTPLTVTINAVSNTYYLGGVSGKPQEILEYLALITDDGTGNASAVFATDTIPTHVTLVTGATYGSGSGTVFARAKYGASETSMDTGNTLGLNGVAHGMSTGASAGSTMTFNLGTGCTNAFPGGGGTLATTEQVYVIYQARIN